MSEHHEEDDFKPTTTPGYKPAAAKSLDEYAKLDAEDESLARWKASLGIAPGGASAAPAGPKVEVLTLELQADTLPPGKRLLMNLQDRNTLETWKNNPVTIKEGIEYNVCITFRVNGTIVNGLRYLQVARRGPLKDKMEQMLGSYGPSKGPEPYTKRFETEESPAGMLARGKYDVRSRVIDDDGQVYLDWNWAFKLAKEW